MQQLADTRESGGLVTQTTRRLARTTWLERGVRLGLAARGLVFVLLGALVAQIAAGALGSPDVRRPASLPGVADALEARPGGTAIVCVLAVGLALYAVFSLVDTILHHDDETPRAKRWGDRALSAWGFLMYAAFCAYCLVTAFSGTSSSQSSSHDTTEKTELTADVLRWPGGPVWLGLFAAILLGMAVFLITRAARRSFRPRLNRDEMSAHEWRIALVLGTVGYLGRAGLFGLVGGCVMAAAAEDRPRFGQGVNGAVRVVAASTPGPPLLGVLAATLVIYGLYMFVETRFRFV